MKYADISNPERIDRIPDKTIQILSDGTTVEKGYKIKNIQLRLYTEKNDKKLGPVSYTHLTLPTNREV